MIFIYDVKYILVLFGIIKFTNNCEFNYIVIHKMFHHKDYGAKLILPPIIWWFIGNKFKNKNVIHRFYNVNH
jgi:hypothetical protein